MEVFRISSEKYARSLTASGVSNRWNKDKQFVIYTGQSRSLSTLESVVHTNSMPTLKSVVMVISIADADDLYSSIHLKDLPPNWKDLAAYPLLQDLGSDWYVRNKSLVLKVPSAIIPQEFNYVINLNHPDFSPKTVSLVRTESYFWEKRLF